MRLIRLTVRARIYLGFAVLVALSLGIAVFGVYQFSRVSSSVGQMDVLAANSQRVLTITRQLEAVRRAETRYQVDATEASMKDARDNATAADALLTDAIKVVLSEERRTAYHAVQDTLRTHLTNLDQFGQLSTTWVAERAKLFAGGDALTAATDKLVAAARATDDEAAGNAADRVERTMLLVRLASWRFIATQDSDGVGTFLTSVVTAGTALTSMQGVAPPDVAQLIAPVRTALAAYETSFRAFSTARLAVAALYNDQMRPQILTMQQQLDAAATSLGRDFGVSRSAAFAAISSASGLQEILAIAALVFGSGLAFVIGRGIVRPLAAMTGVMGRLADGDRTVEIPSRDNQDEIGDMARAVEVFKQHAIEAERLEREQEAARSAKERRSAAMEQHTQDFGNSISGVMASLAGSAEGMRRAAESMAQAADAVRDEAGSTAGGATKSSQDLTAVAAAVEELNTSVGEISRQLAEAADVARQAVQRADSSHATMQGLSEATARIGDVVHLINDIAGQTNLLALSCQLSLNINGISISLPENTRRIPMMFMGCSGTMKDMVGHDLILR